MANDTRIAGELTVEDWDSRTNNIEALTEEQWGQLFEDFFIKRLKTRYLDPIEIIEKHQCSKAIGEGFLITTIICSIIEFLSSTKEGITFRWVRNERDLEEHEYKNSKKLFTKFLRNEKPFSNYIIDDSKSEEFYSSIRCGLIHEAATKNGWKIQVGGSETICFNKKILWRDSLLQDIKSYIEDYNQKIKINTDLQNAFKRKFDHLSK